MLQNEDNIAHLEIIEKDHCFEIKQENAGTTIKAKNLMQVKPRSFLVSALVLLVLFILISITLSLKNYSLFASFLLPALIVGGFALKLIHWFTTTFSIILDRASALLTIRQLNSFQTNSKSIRFELLRSIELKDDNDESDFQTTTSPPITIRFNGPNGVEVITLESNYFQNRKTLRAIIVFLKSECCLESEFR